MWVAKFKLKHKGCFITPLTIKYGISDFIYLMNSWQEKGFFYYTEYHILQGKDIKGFVKALKKMPSMIKCEVKGNNVVTLNKVKIEAAHLMPAFDSRIIQVKPSLINYDGYEYWEMASWDRNRLMDIMNIPNFETKINYIQKTKLENLFLPKLLPNLPKKQKAAIELAIKEGYYEYPRKIHLEKLAKLSKVKRQTFQENLRRAEKKLVPFLTEKLY